MTREGQPQPLSERENAILESDRAQRVWDEALDRLKSSSDFDELSSFTASPKQSTEEVESFLAANSSRLTEEGKFFLTMTIELRKAKDRQGQAKG